MKFFKILNIIVPLVLLTACNQTNSNTNTSDEYEAVGDLSKLPPIQGVPIEDGETLEKYTAEVDRSCNTNILCNIENAYTHFDAMNKDLQRNPTYRLVYNQNVNGIFALQCGNDVIRDIARYRITNELRVDVVTRNGEHHWCKGDYNLVSFLRGRRVKYIDFNGTQTPNTPAPVEDSNDYHADEPLDDSDYLGGEVDIYSEELDDDCGEIPCDLVEVNGSEF